MNSLVDSDLLFLGGGKLYQCASELKKCRDRIAGTPELNVQSAVDHNDNVNQFGSSKDVSTLKQFTTLHFYYNI